MKHKYTDEQLQAAIDASIKELNKKREQEAPTYTANYTHAIALNPNYPSFKYESQNRLDLIKLALSCLPDSLPPVVEGKTPGQVAFGRSDIGAAIARMEAILPEMLAECFDAKHVVSMGALERVKAKLIAAARGEEIQPAAVDWKAKYEELEYQRDELARKNNNQRQYLEGIGRILGIDTDSVTIIKETAASWRYRAEKAEELAATEKRKRLYAEEQLGILAKTFGYEGRTWCNMVSYLCPRLQKAEAELANAKLPRLRPLAEAGPVPEGAVRLFGMSVNGFTFNTLQTARDTHFIDIFPPEEVKPDPFAELKAAHAAGKVIQSLNRERGNLWQDCLSPAFEAGTEYRIKPEPATFQAQGHTWTRHTPGDPRPVDGEVMVNVITRGEFDGQVLDDEPQEAVLWTWEKMEGYSYDEIIGYRLADEPDQPPSESWRPKIGESVWLKCGSPEMTVMDIEENDEVWCSWFDGNTILGSDFPTSSLSPQNTN